ncbi:unnamed protein product [Cuscuta campestris]|uniref:Uncharacterized protein n=1 Tax=Cuscuta campestris TaxID=132261 RepID=A0A484KGB7_9ASTE|nr:unnamed protein product [Cuscuta campestris]
MMIVIINTLRLRKKGTHDDVKHTQFMAGPGEHFSKEAYLAGSISLKKHTLPETLPEAKKHRCCRNLYPSKSSRFASIAHRNRRRPYLRHR